MFPGSPAPLPATTPFKSLLRLLRAGSPAGVWLRGCPGPRLLHGPERRRLLLCYDLGVLLRRCRHIVVRHGSQVALLSASQLVRCRVLQIVLGTPFLPPPAQLRELFPALTSGRGTYAVPIGLGSAEEALAICAAEGVPVASSRIAYGAISG